MLELLLLLENEILLGLYFFYFFFKFLRLAYDLKGVRTNSIIEKVEFRLEFSRFKNYFSILLVALLYYNYHQVVYQWFLLDFLFYSDDLIFFFQNIVIILYFIFFIVLYNIGKDYYYYYEYFFILLIILGFGLLAFKIYDLMYLYLLFELISLSLYILASTNYFSVRIAEAGLKYFVVAIISSLFFLFGLVQIYSFYGSLNLYDLNLMNALMLNTYSVGDYDLLIVGIIFLLVSFFFKIGLAPFHVWIVEVYSGVSLFTFFFFAIISKYIFIIIFLKLYLQFFIYFAEALSSIYLYVGVFSIIIGSIGGFVFQNARSLLAFASIGHVGFMLLSLLGFNLFSYYSFIFYLLVYLFLSVGVYVFYLSISINNYSFELIDEYASLKGAPLISFFLLVVFLSMAGLPPLLGFFAKFYVFLSFQFLNIDATYLIILILILNTIGLYIYIRFIVYLFFSSEKYYPYKISSFVKNYMYSFIVLNVVGFWFSIYFYSYYYFLVINALTCHYI